MTILVTGAAGLVGAAVLRRLATDDRALIATDLNVTSVPDGVRFEPADLTDQSALNTLFQRGSIDTVIHCGAISGPMVAAGNPHLVMAVNIGGTLNLAEAARKAGIARFVAMSSISVYGDQDTLDPVTEDAPLRATDVYGGSKIAMEAVLRAYRYDLGLPVIVLRLASVYGPGRKTDCFIRDLIRSGADGNAVSLDQDSGSRRQFIHVDDVARAIIQAVTTPEWDSFVYNVGGGEWLTEREVATVAATVLPRLEISSIPAPARSIDGHMGILDYSLATSAFGYTPSTDLHHGFASYAAHLAAQMY